MLCWPSCGAGCRFVSLIHPLTITLFNIHLHCFIDTFNPFQVVDEIKDYHTKYTCIMYVDFMEALARVAEMKSLPPKEEVQSSGESSQPRPLCVKCN